MIKMDDATYDNFIERIDKITTQNEKLKLINKEQAKVIVNHERLIYEQDKILKNQKALIENILAPQKEENELEELEF